MILPLTYEAKPMENICTAELMLIKPPRYRASTAPVIMAMAGTIRLDMQIMSNVVTPSATGTGTLGRLVSNRIGTAVDNDVRVNTRSLPERSDQRPTQFMLKTVQSPPHT